MRSIVSRSMLSLVVLALLAACATTKLGTVWKDEAYQGHPKKMMIMGGLKDPANRRLFEDEMVRQLKAVGTDAFASYAVLPEPAGISRDTIIAKMNEAGADSVLIARLMDKKAVTSYVSTGARMAPVTGYPGYGTGWYGYYTYNPGYAVQDEFAILQTNVFDLKTDKLIWTAASETWMSESADRLIKAFIDVIMDRLEKDRMVAGRK